MKKVLIVSYYFPPLNSIAAKRYGTMCKYFKENGYDAYVLTTNIRENVYFGAKKDLNIPIDEKKIFRISQNSSHYGLKIKAMNLMDSFLKRNRIDSRGISIGDFSWYENVKEIINLEKIKDIDIVIGTYGPIGNLYIAKYISGKLGCPYIADIRDLISEWREVPKGHKRCFIIDSVIERWLLSSASGIMVVTKGFKGVFVEKYPNIKTITIFNGWDGILTENPSDIKNKYLYYAGSLYEHRLESFFVLLKALKKINETEEIRLIVRSIGPKDLDNKAKKAIEAMGLKNCVEVLPPATEDIIKKEQSAAYVNIILSSIHEENFEQMITVPGKTYELMHEKPPVLGIASKQSEVAALISYTKKGIVTASENEIVNFVLFNCRKYTGNSNIVKFSRKYQAKRLCKFMDYILKEK
ncbi:hypothetical protein IMSAG249_01408 [Lachnospiraceae bacterium]|nr:hypothetical protein IMSAGC009_00937 [Lachnospiraceae bacterium]GFI69585.1 hypothetical protein IMSAG249_01408 [Lachnospiraceae bacterium]